MSHDSLQRFDALTFPLNGRRLIEASAGTGKTYSIASLYVRLVLGHGDETTRFAKSLLPPDILVVTFTEAASFELRGRIRQKLILAARVFRQQDDADPVKDEFLHKLRSDFTPEQWPALALLLERAADWMDEAAIYTIHGFSKRVLQQHAVESGSPFAQTLAEDASEPILAAVRDYWRQFYYPLNGTQARRISSLFVGPDKLAARLKPALAQGVAVRVAGQPVSNESTPQALLAEWEAWAAAQQQREQAARDGWLAGREQIERCLIDALARKDLKGGSYQGVDARLTQISVWAEGGEPDTGSTTFKELLPRYGSRGLEKNRSSKGQAIEPLPVFALIDAVVDGWSSEPVVDQARLLGHALHWVKERLQQQKDEQGVWQFDDLLLRLNQALRAANGGVLAAAIRQRYPVALIDEFQDTDPIQYDNFDRVYSTADSALFMVGDPKQAIYGFRGGDIHTYLKAREACAPHHYTLGINYRSTRQMVAAVNHLFSAAEAAWPDGAFCLPGKSLPFHPVEAQDRDIHLTLGDQRQPALTLWQLAAGQTVQAGEYRSEMARRTATYMAGLLASDSARLGGRPVQAGDMAVLVRGGTEAAVMRQALADAGLRSVYLSERGSVYASAEAHDLLRWLEACAEPGRESLVRTALATTTLQRSLAELDRLFADELAWQDELAFWRELRELWRHQGVMPMLRHLLDHYQLAARLLAQNDGERRLTNLLHLFELLQQAATEIRGELSLLRYLADYIRQPQDDSKTGLMRLESDAALVKVVTLHKSKGLQYPLVFMPFVCAPLSMPGSHEQGVRYYDNGQSVVDLAPDEAGQQAAAIEQMQEALRVLYVGLTRAEHALWLGVASVRSGKDGKQDNHLHQTALGYLLGGGAPLDNVAWQQALGRCVQGQAADSLCMLEAPAAHMQQLPQQVQPEVLRPARQMRRQLGRLPHWWIASYSALTREQHGPEAETARQDKLQSDRASEPAEAQPAAQEIVQLQNFPAGARYGNVLHELLEAAALFGFNRVLQAPDLLQLPLQQARKQLQSWQAAGGEQLEEWLQFFLAAQLPISELGAMALRLGDLAPQQYQAEMEFWLPARSVDVRRIDQLVSAATLAAMPRQPVPPNQLNGMLKGFMDLVAEVEGRYYVIDYKSNRLPAYDSETLRAAVLQHRYELQYSLYLLALHRLLQSRLADYDYDRHIGGALYIFLRGNAVHFEKPPKTMIEHLDDLLAGESA